MGGWRTLALAGCVSTAAMTAAAPAGAITLVLGSGDLQGFLGVYTGGFDLNPYLFDNAGRVYQITSATLSAFAHSNPNYGLPVTKTVDTDTGTTFSFSPPSLTYNVSRVVTTTYADNHADSLTLSTMPFIGQSVTGTVSQVLDDIQTTDGGVIDGPPDLPFPLPFPASQHTTITDVTVHHALYGDVDLSEILDAQTLADANLGHSLNVFLTAALAFNFDPFDPSNFDSSSQFDASSFEVSLSFERTQIAGPPPDTQPPSTSGAPEPAAWALLIAGFGLAGASLRRRVRPA